MGLMKSKSDDENKPREVWTVLPHHMGGGPCGLGVFLSLCCYVVSQSCCL